MNENLKLVAKAGVDLVEKISEVFADGKISGAEAFSFLPVLLAVPGILEKKEEIKAEIKALDAAGRADIRQYVADELELPNNPALERKIEKGAGVIVAILDLVDEFKKPAAPPQPGEAPQP